MARILFDATRPDLAVVRRVVLERLRDASWEQMDYSGDGFDPFVEYVGQQNRQLFAELARQVCFGLMVEGILVPGLNIHNPNPPWFARTEYGRKIIAEGDSTPHDPDGYLAKLSTRVPQVDPTVFAYLVESLNTFRSGNQVASAVMLGIAAERVFLLLCDSILNALQDASEKKKFQALVSRFPMKPKMDWVHRKIQSVQDGRSQGFPDNATVMVTAIYDLLRVQRNDLGHPRETPPSISREDAFVNLQIFPRYYETAETVRTFLKTNKI